MRTELFTNRRTGSVLRKAFVPVRPIIENAIRRETPVDTGDLLTQVESRIRSARGTILLAAGYAVPAELRSKMLAIEFGNTRTRPQAPLRIAFERAFDEMREAFFNRLTGAIDDNIDVYRRRAERRARRLGL